MGIKGPERYREIEPSRSWVEETEDPFRFMQFRWGAVMRFTSGCNRHLVRPRELVRVLAFEAVVAERRWFAPGVYMLVDEDGTRQYFGSATKNLLDRSVQHWGNKKFSRILGCLLPESEVRSVEKVLISCFRPPLNIIAPACNAALDIGGEHHTRVSRNRVIPHGSVWVTGCRVCDPPTLQ